MNKIITLALSMIVSLSLIFMWIVMSFGFMEENEKFISIGIVVSLLFTALSLRYVTLDELKGKGKRSVMQKTIGTISLIFLLLAILQQISFGWFVFVYYISLGVLVYIAEHIKEEK
jgi:hypothetical protein